MLFHIIPFTYSVVYFSSARVLSPDEPRGHPRLPAPLEGPHRVRAPVRHGAVGPLTPRLPAHHGPGVFRNLPFFLS